MPFACLVAVRFLREGRFQTVLIAGGIAIGVAVIVFITALIGGLQASTIERTLGTQPHIVVRPPKELARPLRDDGAAVTLPNVQPRTQRLRSIDQWQTLQAELAAHPGVAALSPLVSGPGLAVRGEANESIALLGIEPERYLRIVDVAAKLVAGRFRVSATEAVIGVELADDLGARVGDKIRIETAGGRSETFTVAGIFDLGSRDLNQRYVYIGLRSAQTLLDLVGGVSQIDLKVKEIFSAEAIARDIAAATSLTADSWMTTNAQLLTALRAQSISTGIIRFFVALSVAFGIASVLVVSVVQRARDIGILRAMGTPRRRVMAVFLIQGGLLGLIGSSLGVAAGAGLALLFMRVTGGRLFTLEMEPSLFLGATALATLTGLAAATAPALRAARLDPVTVIRG